MMASAKEAAAQHREAPTFGGRWDYRWMEVRLAGRRSGPRALAWALKHCKSACSSCSRCQTQLEGSHLWPRLLLSPRSTRRKAGWCSTRTAARCRPTAATPCCPPSSGRWLGVWLSWWLAAGWVAPQAPPPHSLPCSGCSTQPPPHTCTTHPPAHLSPTRRSYWSPAATTGQRYIYTGSYDGRVVIYGARLLAAAAGAAVAGR